MTTYDGDPAEVRSGAQAVERAIAVLNTFVSAGEPLALVDVARQTGLHVSTAHRLVRALVRGRLLEQETTTERYRLGWGCALLGQAAARLFGLERAEAELHSLAEQSGESASLGVREGNDVVVLVRVESPQALRFDRPPGTHIGLHASAMGKALLAFGSADLAHAVSALGSLHRYTTHTLTTQKRLVADLVSAKQQGWTLNDEEQHLGVRAVGAPVLDGRGFARAAVAVQGPTVRLDGRRLTLVAHMVTASAERLAAILPLDRLA